MALNNTYAGLQSSVADWLNRTDLAALIPDLIAMAEAQINRKVRATDAMKSTTLAVSTSSTALPSDFNGIVSFELPSGSGTPLRYMRPEGLRAERQTNYASTGTPFGWTIIGTNLETIPAPSQSFTCTLVYYSTLPPLASNTTNWLLTKHPDAYLFGALLQAAPYLKDDARIQSWGSLYEAAIDDILASDGRTAFGHGLTPPYRGAAYPQGTDPQPSPMPAVAGS